MLAFACDEFPDLSDREMFCLQLLNRDKLQKVNVSKNRRRALPFVYRLNQTLSEVVTNRPFIRNVCDSATRLLKSEFRHDAFTHGRKFRQSDKLLSTLLFHRMLHSETQNTLASIYCQQ